MLDERWSDEVEAIGDALRKMLMAESSAQRVRAAESRDDARDPALEKALSDFGLDDLEAGPELFARIAFELGRAIAATAYVETIPVLALTGRAGIAFGFDRPVPATLKHVAVRRDDGVYVEPIRGAARRSAAGDILVSHQPGGEGERIGDDGLADRIARHAALIDAARMVGAGQALLAHGNAYASERAQFGKIIGSFQGVAHRLARAAGDLDAAELLVRKAAFTADPANGGDGAPSAHFALMVRAKAVEAARGVATDVHQVFGGNGFAMEYDVQLFSRRLRSWAMRGSRPQADLAALGRMVLDPTRRDDLKLVWHYEQGMPLPRWAREADNPVA